jgi:mannose/cellobiose epimerase-like protein (N-acyl-D-glucosamine 2-epimerase family)
MLLAEVGQRPDGTIIRSDRPRSTARRTAGSIPAISGWPHGHASIAPVTGEAVGARPRRARRQAALGREFADMITGRLCRATLLLLLLGPSAFAQAYDSTSPGSVTPATRQEILQALPTGERWLAHAIQDLMPFWTQPAALGDPPGAFPSTRCNDGSLVDDTAPCPEIRDNEWLSWDRRRYLVALSRQTYGYGVLFHLIGDPRLLDLMKAGVNYIRKNAVDREGGGMFTRQAAGDGAWGPQRALRASNELAYGLLGLSFYYYLTRDAAVLPDILAIKDYIFSSYHDEKLGTLRWMPRADGEAGGGPGKLMAQLDQMNAYLVLLASILPEPHRTEARTMLVRLSRLMIDQFYAPADNVFVSQVATPEDLSLDRTGTTDFGHTIKAMWMIRFSGLLAGEPDLVRFAEENGRRVLERAYLEDTGSWAKAPLKGGQLDIDKSWWIYCELDQFAGTLGMSDLSAARYLPRTYDYWFRYFVDHRHREVWTGIDGATNQPQQDMPKAWPWKNAYHSLEHALVGYITGQQIHGEPATLYFAFEDPSHDMVISPYFFTGTVAGMEHRPDDRGGAVQAVTFRDVR